MQLPKGYILRLTKILYLKWLVGAFTKRSSEGKCLLKQVFVLLAQNYAGTEKGNIENPLFDAPSIFTRDTVTTNGLLPGTLLDCAPELYKIQNTVDRLSQEF